MSSSTQSRCDQARPSYCQAPAIQEFTCIIKPKCFGTLEYEIHTGGSECRLEWGHLEANSQNVNMLSVRSSNNTIPPDQETTVAPCALLVKLSTPEQTPAESFDIVVAAKDLQAANRVARFHLDVKACDLTPVAISCDSTR